MCDEGRFGFKYIHDGQSLDETGAFGQGQGNGARSIRSQWKCQRQSSRFILR